MSMGILSCRTLQALDRALEEYKRRITKQQTNKHRAPAAPFLHTKTLVQHEAYWLRNWKRGKQNNVSHKVCPSITLI